MVPGVQMRDPAGTVPGAFTPYGEGNAPLWFFEQGGPASYLEHLPTYSPRKVLYI